MAKIILNDNKYYFDAEDGRDSVELKVWNEKSKATEKHPEGKPWIVLPKGNITNRQYFSEDKFIEENVDGVCEVEIKTSAPRVLGASGGVKQVIVKYLDADMAEEYTNLVNKAVAEYKEAKAQSKKKKIEDMSIEELQLYVEALKEGRNFTVGKTGPQNFMDCFTEEEYQRYNELIAIATENKANAPKAKRGPLTDEEKAARKIKRQANELSKAEKLLAALLAAQNGTDTEEVEDAEEEFDIDNL